MSRDMGVYLASNEDRNWGAPKPKRRHLLLERRARNRQPQHADTPGVVQVEEWTTASGVHFGAYIHINTFGKAA